MGRDLFGFSTPKVPSLGNAKSQRRTLGIRDKQILLERARHKCEACNKKISFSEMQAGHKQAATKGGTATLRNSVCLCYRCNKLQGTDSWQTFMKKMGKAGAKSATTQKRKATKNTIKKPAKKTAKKKTARKKKTRDPIMNFLGGGK